MDRIGSYSTENSSNKNCLENNENRMWNLFSAAMAKIVGDEELTLLYGNDAFFAIGGYDKEEFNSLFQNKLKPLIHVDDYERIFNIIRKKGNGDSSEHHLRIKTSSKETIWVSYKAKCSDELTENQQQIYYVVVDDITRTREIQKKLQIEEERYRLISEISDDITFEYDVNEDVLYLGKKYEEIFRKNPVIYGFKQFVIENNLVQNESMENFMNVFQMRMRTNEKYYIELKLNLMKHKPEWYGMHYTGIFDEENRLCKIIGKLGNIDKQVKEREQLLMKSQVDPMTKLLNKVTVEKEISQHLSNADEYSLGGFLIIDVDNFKSINDTLGHLFGDAVLKDIAKHIKKVFRTKDITGRVGGDEFIIFMKDISSKQVVYEKAKQLCEGIEGLYSNNKWNKKTSVSIGVAIQEGKDHTYTDLFQKADIALYHAKERGKNCFEVFKDKVDMTAYSNSHIDDSPLTDISGYEMQKNGRSDLLKLTLSTLNGLHDLAFRISTVLELIGNSMNLCKVTLGLLQDKKMIAYQYQWKRNSTQRMLDNTEEVQIDYDVFRSLFDAEGIFSSSDPESVSSEVLSYLCARGAKSILQYSITYQGDLIATMGIQYCIENRMWVENEVETLQIVSQIIAGYIRKQE